METVKSILDILTGIYKDYDQYLAAISAVLVSMYSLALIIPGKYPEVWIEKALEFTKKISKK